MAKKEQKRLIQLQTALTALTLLTLTSTVHTTIRYCRYESFGRCKECLEGYRLSTSRRSCIACTNYCGTCNDQFCTACKSSGTYEISSNALTGEKVCGGCISGCKKCSNATLCESCSPLHEINEAKTKCTLTTAGVVFLVLLLTVPYVICAVIGVIVCCCVAKGAKSRKKSKKYKQSMRGAGGTNPYAAGGFGNPNNGGMGPAPMMLGPNGPGGANGMMLGPNGPGGGNGMMLGPNGPGQAAPPMGMGYQAKPGF